MQVIAREKGNSVSQPTSPPPPRKAQWDFFPKKKSVSEEQIPCTIHFRIRTSPGKAREEREIRRKKGRSGGFFFIC